MELYDLKNDPGEFTNLAGDSKYSKTSKSLSCNLKLSESRLVLPISGLAERKSEGRFLTANLSCLSIRFNSLSCKKAYFLGLWGVYA